MSPTLAKKRAYVGVLLGLVVGIVCTMVYRQFFDVPVAGPGVLRQSHFRKNEYSYINPLLVLNPAESPLLQPLKSNISHLIDQYKANNKATNVSVYYKDLNNGRWFGLDTDEVYSPGSMLKVMTMIAYFKYAERDYSILSHKLYYDGVADQNVQENLPSKHQITKGWYTVEDLISYMVKYSDNNAARLLNAHLNQIDPSFLNQPFLDLGLDTISTTDDYLTISDYSLFFRVLYNSTYLSREMSERALGIMTQTDFTKGISRDLPAGITVAQKFGEFSIVDETGNPLKRELHNCGIVYDKDAPYLLCVMTKGIAFPDLEDIIAEISSTIYSSPRR